MNQREWEEVPGENERENVYVQRGLWNLCMIEEGMFQLLWRQAAKSKSLVYAWTLWVCHSCAFTQFFQAFHRFLFSTGFRCIYALIWCFAAAHLLLRHTIDFYALCYSLAARARAHLIIIPNWSVGFCFSQLTRLVAPRGESLIFIENGGAICKVHVLKKRNEMTLTHFIPKIFTINMSKLLLYRKKRKEKKSTERRDAFSRPLSSHYRTHTRGVRVIEGNEYVKQPLQTGAK